MEGRSARQGGLNCVRKQSIVRSLLDRWLADGCTVTLTDRAHFLIILGVTEIFVHLSSLNLLFTNKLTPSLLSPSTCSFPPRHSSSSWVNLCLTCPQRGQKSLSNKHSWPEEQSSHGLHTALKLHLPMSGCCKHYL